MEKNLSASSRPARLKSTRSGDIANRQWTESERRAVARIARRQARGEGPSDRSLADIPPLSPAQLAAMVRLRDVRPKKVAVSVRLDRPVLDWLKSKGEGHLTRINDILTNLMEAESSSGHKQR